ncbi:MAG: glycosyltransferase [Phycisphaeraceae bacterium]
MRVLMFSDVQRKGGAGIAAHRLARALTQAGHQVLWAAVHPDADNDIPSVRCQSTPLSDRAKRRLLRVIGSGAHTSVSARGVMQQLNRIIQRYKPDVINIHNIHGADLPATLPSELSRQVPVVWTLHDMWAFTGGCAYSYGCEKFTSACDTSCPHTHEYPARPARQVPRLYAARLRSVHRADRIAYVSPSGWLAEQAKRGMLSRQDVRVIHNSVELDRFRPVPKEAARAALDLPSHQPVLVTTATPDDPRKGASVLYEALSRLERRDVILLQLGGGNHDPSEGRWVHRVLSAVRDDRLLRLAYCAGDAHLLPTRADNLPNTLLESAACGVPSIVSDVGGCSEAIEPSRTGWVFKDDDPTDLSRCIRHVLSLSNEAQAEARRASRAFACNRFAPELQAERYACLFNELIGTHASRTSYHSVWAGDTFKEAA